MLFLAGKQFDIIPPSLPGVPHQLVDPTKLILPVNSRRPNRNERIMMNSAIEALYIFDQYK